MAYAFGLSPPMAAVLGKVQMGWCSFATSTLRPMCHENRTKMNEAQLQFKDPKSRPNGSKWSPHNVVCIMGHGPPNLLSSVRSKHACCLRSLPIARSCFQYVPAVCKFCRLPHVALPKVVATNVGVQHQAQLPGNINQETYLRNRLATLESAPLAKIYQR